MEASSCPRERLRDELQQAYDAWVIEAVAEQAAAA